MIFWTATIIIFLMEGVLPAFTSQTDIAREGIRHLGYPAYFGNALVIFKVIGALVLVVPAASQRIKEFAYAGFAYTLTFAAISHTVVDGFGFQAVLPLIFLGILGLSYFHYHKLKKVVAN
ncbi:DoxX family protein [Flavobacterium silvaticum]|nr:DoxX family protein [Flavobacterium silvaticum]